MPARSAMAWVRATRTVDCVGAIVRNEPYQSIEQILAELRMLAEEAARELLLPEGLIEAYVCGELEKARLMALYHEAYETDRTLRDRVLSAIDGALRWIRHGISIEPA